MQLSASVFSQITTALYPAKFARCAQLFPNPRPTRGLTAYDQFLALCFSQLTYRESLRDIVACLQSKGPSLYHLGFRGNLSRTNLAYANHHRDWRLLEALAHVFMRRTGRLGQQDPSDPDLPKVAFALDSSVIALCVNLFPWGYYARARKAAVKLHLPPLLTGKFARLGGHRRSRFSRHEYARSHPRDPGCLRCDGPRLSGFGPSFPTASGRRIFCGAQQVSGQIPGNGLPAGR